MLYDINKLSLKKSLDFFIRYIALLHSLYFYYHILLIKEKLQFYLKKNTKE